MKIQTVDFENGNQERKIFRTGEYMMDYQEVLANARKTILNCKACPECNGLACGNTLPGPGSKAPGNGAHDNWKAWKSRLLRQALQPADPDRTDRIDAAIQPGGCHGCL